MLNKSQRLSREDFSKYFTTGKRQNGQVLTLVFTPTASLQVAVVVGKKVAKKAVKRNRLRRLGYRLLEVVVKDKAVLGAVIVIIKPNITSLSRKEQIEAINNDLGLLIK